MGECRKFLYRPAYKAGPQGPGALLRAQVSIQTRLQSGSFHSSEAKSPICFYTDPPTKRVLLRPEAPTTHFVSIQTRLQSGSEIQVIYYTMSCFYTDPPTKRVWMVAGEDLYDPSFYTDPPTKRVQVFHPSLTPWMVFLYRPAYKAGQRSHTNNFAN